MYSNGRPYSIRSGLASRDASEYARYCIIATNLTFKRDRAPLYFQNRYKAAARVIKDNASDDILIKFDSPATF